MKKAVLILIASLSVWGCATVSSDYRLGTEAELNKNYDQAVKSYEKACLEHPRDEVYRVALMRAKSAAALYHIANARALAAEGKKKEAADEYAMALIYTPRNRRIVDEIKALEAPPSPPEKAEEDIMAPPVRLKNAEEKVNLSFRSPVSLRSIFDTLSRMFGVAFVYDDQFRDASLAIDLSGKNLEQAINYLCVASRTFDRVIDDKTVLIAPDNYQKRLQYELVGIKTFYLSNINAQDVLSPLTQLIRAPNKMPVIQADKNMNSITIRDTPQVLRLAGKILRQWDKAKPEVLIEVEMMEVSRMRLQQFGVDLSNALIGLRFNPAEGGTDEGWVPLKGLGNKLKDLANYEVSLPDAALDFLENDSDTKFIAQPRVRGVSGEDMRYLVGQKVPIPTSTFTPIFAGGTQAQPIVSYNLQDIGVELKMKPQVHLEDEVTIELEVKISAISGTGYADIPIIATREVKNTIRLKDGETNLLAGLLRDEERKSITGIIGLKDIPLLGQLFSRTQSQIDQSDVVLTLTPHIIRSLSIGSEESKPLWVESDSFSGISGAGQRSAQEEAQAAEEAAQGPPGEPQAGPGANAVFFAPASLELTRGREFRVNVEVAADKPIGNLSLNVVFDSQVLKLKDILEGGLTRMLGDKSSLLKVIDASGCSLGFSSPSLGSGFKGQAVLAVLVFTAEAPGQATVGIANYSAMGPNGQAVTLETGQAEVAVK
jgi:general secretion pathway protein D